MPAGTMELYKPKKTRTRYTVIEEDSIESINLEYYGNPNSKEVIEKYRKYMTDNNIDIIDLYKNHNNTKVRQEIWCSLPPNVRRYFHKLFDLKCPCSTKTLVVKRIYR